MVSEEQPDFTIEPQAAAIIMAACLKAGAERRHVLESAVATRGQALDLLSEIIGLANRVALNCKVHAIDLLCEVGMHPHSAEKINMPTLFGALNGVIIAAGIDESKVCSGCAFRLGSVANQCPSTTIDAFDCSQPGEQPFLCHEELSPRGRPFKACAGFGQARKRMKDAVDG